MSTRSGTSRLSTAEAAARLGVKEATVYAYVSRGVLTSRRSPDGRRSSFSEREVDALARRGRPRRATAGRSLDVPIETAITRIEQGHLTYRGLDTVELSETATFEQVAGLLVTGQLTAHETWPVASRIVPRTESVFDHLLLTAAIAGMNDPVRHDLAPGAVAQTVRRLVATVVDSRPAVGDGRVPRLAIGGQVHRSTIAGRLWTRISPRHPAPEMLRAFNAALVLLADHELAVSTMAVRVAASARADPYAVIGAGLAALSGPLHGAASAAAARMLRAAVASRAPADLAAERAAGEALAREGRYPGFGHKVYRSGDPRAVALLSRVRELGHGTREVEVLDATIDLVARRRGVYPNVDLALAALGLVARADDDFGENVFAIARVAGWCAHALEEYGAEPLRYRARARYVGP